MTPDLAPGIGPLDLLTLLGLVAFGSVVPVVPTGAAVSAAAVLARNHHPWEIALVVACGGAGAYLGDLVTYAVLRVAGAPLAQRVGWLHADDPEGTLRRLRQRIEANEVRALLLSRLIPAGRIPVLLAASLGGYPLAKFAVADTLAALLWALMYAAIGVVGHSLIPNTTIALVVVIAVAAVLGIVLPRLRRDR
ncbi:DedA family protein [Nocardioides mangrovicus]|uniref:DedA family protein n=1 Tax=Nocardioides mangrovicus TaxID=2478913 RepID=UPI001313DFA5|nr:VTT domain-containing protein [Nocardioides mangrovicus]